MGEYRAWYSMMLKIFSGLLLEVIMVVTPAAVAISAAMSFVSIPPVPRLDPSVVVLTINNMSIILDKVKIPPSKRMADIEFTTSICLAEGSFRGFDV